MNKLTELWTGTPGAPVNEWPESAQQMMRRQGFDKPVTLWAHLERLEDRVAKLEEQAKP